MVFTSSENTSQSNINFPRSLGYVSRAEFFEGEGGDGALELQLTEDSGPLPSDLTGHVFIIGPVGSVDQVTDSKITNIPNAGNRLKAVVQPAADGWTALFNGDGMIYRIDFRPESRRARFNSRLIKAPCYYLDQETYVNQEIYQKKEGFTSYGITRFSPRLGMRNYLNTAFLPLISNDPNQPDRMLATWDAGRPYEIDIETLETITPVGRLTDWNILNPSFKVGFPFAQIQTSAHPCFDREKQQFITVNICKSLLSFLPDWKTLTRWENITYFLKKYYRFINNHGLCKFLNTIAYFIGKLPATQGVLNHPIALLKGLFPSSLYLVIWDVEKDVVSSLKKYQVKLDDGSRIGGSSITIKQTVHQIGLTKDYIVLVDTAFKLNLEETIGSPKEKRLIQLLTKAFQKSEEDEESSYKEIEGLLRALLDYPQLPNSNLYIIKRADIEQADRCNQNTIFAHKIVLKGEIAHFLVDYANPNDQISLHAAFSCAWDVATWQRSIDQFKGHSIDNTLDGLICGPLDLSRLGRIILDGKTGKVLSELPLDQLPAAWGPALYAYRDYPTVEQSHPEDKIQHLYWIYTGCYEELLNDHIYHLYKDYPNRIMPIKEVLETAHMSIPGGLLRLDIDSPNLKSSEEKGVKIGDTYELEKGYSLLSPQFVPRVGRSGSMDGYIVCIAHYGIGSEIDNGNQIWIFDAADLKKGPICKLWHPQLKLGFTVHTTWLPKISKRQASYCINVYEDYGAIVKEQPEEVKQLFQKLFPEYTWES